MGIERPKEIDKTTAIQRAEDADKFANKMKQLHQFHREEIAYVQTIQEDYANKKRVSAPNYKIGDYVFPNDHRKT